MWEPEKFRSIILFYKKVMYYRFNSKNIVSINVTLTLF